MTEAMTAAPQESASTLSPREVAAAEIERQVVIAEAKILVDRLGLYLDLIGEWAAEGSEEHHDAAE